MDTILLAAGDARSCTPRLVVSSAWSVASQRSGLRLGRKQYSPPLEFVYRWTWP